MIHHFFRRQIIGKYLKWNLIRIWNWLANGHISGKCYLTLTLPDKKLASHINVITFLNCFWGMVDRRKAFSFISSWGHCQRSSPSRFSETPRAGFESEFRFGWMKLCSSDNHCANLILIAITFLTSFWLLIITKYSLHLLRNICGYF